MLSLSTVVTAEELVVTPQNAPEFYRKFKRMTEHPHWVSLRIAMLCTLPRRDDEEKERKITGVHYNTRVHIYANPSAEQTILTGKPVFPPGAVIVKEKHDHQTRCRASAA